MRARDEILARVRAALSDAVEAPQPPPAPQRTPIGDLVEHFSERVADYRATVAKCSRHELSAAVAEAVPPGSSIVIPRGLPDDVTRGISNVVIDDGSLSYTELDRIDLVISLGTVGLAETGTIVLDHDSGQGRRALTLVPDNHICIVYAERIVSDVEEALRILRPAAIEGRPLTWVSGPSATSDIELVRVEGVHGPRSLHVIVVT